MKKKLFYYKKLYNSSRYLESDKVFKLFFNLDDKFPVPFSISHGFDFNQLTYPLDIFEPEPIHWSYNKILFQKSNAIKPTVLLPHPWAMLNKLFESSKSNAKLLIGPPPSINNDEKLFECLKKNKISPDAILIKPRGNFQRSIHFWKSKGIKPIIAGNSKNHTYFDLFHIISSFDKIISPTLSSVVVYASALGKQIFFIEDYFYKYYDSIEYINTVKLNSDTSREFINLCKQKTLIHKNFSQNLLGYEYCDNKAKILSECLEVMASLKKFIFHKNLKNIIEEEIRNYLALVTSNVGFIDKAFFKIFKWKEEFVAKVEINEIDLVLNGLNEFNFKKEVTNFVFNKNSPGFGGE